MERLASSRRGLLVILWCACAAFPAAAQQRGAGDVDAGASADLGATVSTAARPSLSMGTARQVDTARGDSITLEQAFRAALEGSRDMDAARDRLVEATIELDRAWSTMRPSASVSGSLTRNDKDVRFEQPDGGERVVQELYQPQLNANFRQVVFQGQAYPTVRAMREARRAADMERERLQTEVLYAVATSFYSGLALQSSVVLASRQVDDTRAHLDVVEARHQLEDANRLDLLRAQIDHRGAVEDLLVAEASLESIKVALGTLIGRPHDEGDFTLKRPEELELSFKEMEEDVRLALEQRADLAAMKRQIRAADHLVTAARMAFLPSVDLSANARYSPVISYLRDDQVTWQATMTVTIPIYQGRLRRRQLDSARLRVRQMQRARESLADRVRREVVQARLDLDSAAAQLDRLEGTAELAEETLELTRARYEVGAATSLEITDATSRAFLAKTQVLGGRLDLDMAVLSLARAMGMFEEVAGL